MNGGFVVLEHRYATRRGRCGGGTTAEGEAENAEGGCSGWETSPLLPSSLLPLSCPQRAATAKAVSPVPIRCTFHYAGTWHRFPSAPLHAVLCWFPPTRQRNLRIERPIVNLQKKFDFIAGGLYNVIAQQLTYPAYDGGVSILSGIIGTVFACE